MRNIWACPLSGTQLTVTERVIPYCWCTGGPTAMVLLSSDDVIDFGGYRLRVVPE